MLNLMLPLILQIKSSNIAQFVRKKTFFWKQTVVSGEVLTMVPPPPKKSEFFLCLTNSWFDNGGFQISSSNNVYLFLKSRDFLMKSLLNDKAFEVRE